MRTFELQGATRTIAERSSEQSRALKALRKNNGVPCVLYGGKENINFCVKSDDLRKLIYTPHIYVVNLTIDGVAHTAIMKEIQFHPVKDTILHIDFLEIDDQKPIVMEVPVKLQGLAEGVKAGGKLQQQMRKLKVKALYTDIPEVLNVDVTSLGLGKSTKVADLSYDGLELINPKSAVVCMVKATRAAMNAATNQ